MTAQRIDGNALSQQLRTEVATRAQALKAAMDTIKIPTAKQARARALTGGVARVYPKHQPGMSTAEYVAEYYARNRPPFAGTSGYLDGTLERYRAVAEREYRSETSRKFADGVIAEFFQPLATGPQFARSGEVIEEVLA